MDEIDNLDFAEMLENLAAANSKIFLAWCYMQDAGFLQGASEHLYLSLLQLMSAQRDLQSFFQDRLEAMRTSAASTASTNF